ncbi:enoyl-CoA hydratase/isomerase family protein [Glaciimonas sp. PCH181]|uniref:enoyl-CoA hydratase/isomerase family protein n=1 Tax=Glaciimonas sp. PCH181 TaxID=2133943 RepID=UPI000D3819FE|nr:enoyl-CoA hydratase/isomerase family protein [Glaciimonas sp. PCH181]PUA18454.1 enoyl-CoA hydratase/isomerase family protein [Glaciimonas sp. PCH181]
MTDLLEIDRDQDCWTFTLNRPDKMNALSAPLVEALLEGVENAHVSGARVLVFRGCGKNLSAGFDFGGLDSQSDGDLLLRFVRIETLLHTVASSPCLTVAFAHGRNFGAGVDLFAVCRQRYSTADARFRMPGLKFGLVLGSRRFADLVGLEKALEILQQGRIILAGEAIEIGLATHLLEEGEWSDAITDAQRVARGLDRTTQQQLYQALDKEMPDRDLASVVRSAARPGLKSRITDYLTQ